MTVLEMNAKQWYWSQGSSETDLSQDRLVITDSAQGKAWTSSVSSDQPIPQGLNYYEVRIITCNASNSIKIVFGMMDKGYLNKILKINRGTIGSLRGGCPFGYFKEFGPGSLCYFANGTIAKDGLSIHKAEPLTTNDHIGILFDSTSKSIAFFKNRIHQITVINDYKDEIYLAASLIKQNSIGIVEKPEFPKFSFLDSLTSLNNEKSPTLQQITNGGTPTTTTTTTNNNTTTNPANTTTTTTTTTNNNSTSINNSPSKPVNIPQSSNSHSHSPQLVHEQQQHSHSQPLPHISNIINSNNNNSNNGNSPTTTTTTTTSSTSSLLPTSATTEQMDTISKSLPTVLTTNGQPVNTCPICFIPLTVFGSDLTAVNQHIDECLTLSLLDNETGSPKVYKIDCPYNNCKKSIQSSEFVFHCNEAHFLENHHEYKCPLCKEKPKNLISHLSKSHITVPSLKKQSFIGLGYSTSVLENDLEASNECAICLDEFLKGQTIARLECLCVFHIQCMDFFLKTKKCPVHH